MKAVVMALLALAATAAFADSAADERANRTPFQSVASRAAVQDAYKAARDAGTLPLTSEAAALERIAVPANEQARLHAREEAREAAGQHLVHQLY